jgi:hypothetical protein
MYYVRGKYNFSALFSHAYWMLLEYKKGYTVTFLYKDYNGKKFNRSVGLKYKIEVQSVLI